MPSESDEEFGWDEAMEYHPIYRLLAGLPMDYTEYHERRDAEDESRRWGLPELRG